MSTAVVALPSLAEHLARRAAPFADVLVERMAARRTRFAALALIGGQAFDAYGAKGVLGFAKRYGKRLKLARLHDRLRGFDQGAFVYVITDHVAGWVTLTELCCETCSEAWAF